MSKKHKLEEGQIYAIQLSNGKYTIAQLLNHHKINSRSSEDTFAFFNYLFSSTDEIRENLNTLKLNSPFSIVSSNGYPWDYNWDLIRVKDIDINFNYKKNIGSLGLYNNYSTDPSIFLEPYFGLFPWDGYFKDDYLDKHILINSKMRKDIKYLKDFTTKELKELLPANSPKLINRLKEE
ncbi:hypothetical protein [Tenacibaculum maritimum]|uniref:hypothetical protein n=1 Tax=Tenacibaculum maritimum TaxID=107401 RepID=UPI00041FAFBE|nr:hypothetical protein [Tenacibaculum maritimum]CAA0235000.1 hypothetical protein NACSLCCMFF_510004 [Tenacibaculum maritimum]